MTSTNTQRTLLDPRTHYFFFIIYIFLKDYHWNIICSYEKNIVAGFANRYSFRFNIHVKKEKSQGLLYFYLYIWPTETWRKTAEHWTIERIFQRGHWGIYLLCISLIYFFYRIPLLAWILKVNETIFPCNNMNFFFHKQNMCLFFNSIISQKKIHRNNQFQMPWAAIYCWYYFTCSNKSSNL